MTELLPITTSGFFLINKPSGITSYDVIRMVKRHFPKRKRNMPRIKIGHAGTLDPFASGLLIIAVGRAATSMLPKLVNADKSYTAIARFGISSNTGDRTGTLEEQSITPPSKQELIDAAASFMPGYLQTPPVYSALKHGGMPLYKMARTDAASTQTLERIASTKAKPITITACSVPNYTFPDFTLDCTVSKGTYIRTLVEDIGKRLNAAVTTWQLARTAIGTHTLKEAFDIEVLENRDQFLSHLIPTDRFNTDFSD